MAQDRTDPNDEVPEADRLEQQTPVEPPWLIEAELAPIPESIANPVDEADRLEQQTPVPGGDEDDYPHHPSGVG